MPHLASNLADSGAMICATAMPELPEVETLAADLRPLLTDRVIVSCELRCPSLVRYPDPARFAAIVEGSQIQGVDRRGKYLLLRLQGGDLLVVHLGMTGHLRQNTVVRPPMRADRSGAPHRGHGSPAWP